DHGRSAVSAERIERAVRDVEDLHHPEDQGQTDCDNEQIGRIDEAIGENCKGCQHGDAYRPGLSKIAGVSTRGSGPSSRDLSTQLHFAPFIPPSSQVWESTSAGGFTHSAG